MFRWVCWHSPSDSNHIKPISLEIGNYYSLQTITCHLFQHYELQHNYVLKWNRIAVFINCKCYVAITFGSSVTTTLEYTLSLVCSKQDHVWKKFWNEINFAADRNANLLSIMYCTWLVHSTTSVAGFYSECSTYITYKWHCYCMLKTVSLRFPFILSQ